MPTMNIKCPACDTEIPTDVKLSLGGMHRAEDGHGMYIDISVGSVDHEPMREHYIAAHP